MTPLERITERISREGDVNKASTRRPLLTLEEFFEGNEDDCSVWCNCIPPPSIAESFALLKQIRSRAEVADVRVEVTQFDSPKEWPFSDIVWVITKASAEQVKTCYPKVIAPDETWIGWCNGVKYEPLAIPPGMQPVACWWD
jgi:hypothetical protein